ncbi:hypothetical protein C7271_14745 [filamentous cyanobacterium CCP5]|nr:hypothetical protein C7271_14745 [filamentous cyanobacterium CCP5]
MFRQIFRHLLAAGAIAFLMLTTLIGSPLSAVAAENYSQNQQESQSYPEQATYKGQDSSDYSRDQQSNQAKAQDQQSNQADGQQKQYAQQERSYSEQ